MSSSTSYLGLVKPAYDESADIAVINSNMDTIDSSMAAKVISVMNLNSGTSPAPIAIPAPGQSVTKYVTGLTANHMLIAWRFTSGGWDEVPQDLEWETGAGWFKITNNGRATNVTCRPVFILPKFYDTTDS